MIRLERYGNHMLTELQGVIPPGTRRVQKVLWALLR